MRHTTIKFRLIFLLSSLTIITLALLATIETISYQNTFQAAMDDQTKSLKQKLLMELKRKENVGLAISVALASDQRLHQALETNDRDLAIEVVKQIPLNFKNFSDFQNIKIQLHLPGAISFLRSWKPEKFGDDLSQARPDIVEVQSSLKPSINTGVGKYGTSLRAVVPMVNAQGKLLGTVEVLQGFKSLYDALKQEQVSYLTVFTPDGIQVANRNTSKTMLGEYKVADDKWFGDDAIQAAKHFDLHQLQQKGMVLQGELMAMFLPIEVGENILGGHVIISDISKTTQAMNKFLNSLLLTVALVLGVLLLTIFMVLWSMQRWVFSPLKKLGAVAHEVAQQGDLRLRTKLNQQDELGQFAQSFDSLLDTINNIFDELRNMIKGLAAGNLEQQMKTHYQGDFKSLALDLNQSNEQVHRILHELSTVLDKLAKGDFHAQLSADGYHGIYQHLAGTVNQTTHTLNSAIQELKNAMQHLAEGEFNHKINVELPGQLNELKGHTNQSLLALQDAIDEIATVSGALSQGDLTRQIEKSYQGDLATIKRSINQAIGGLNQAIGSVTEAAQDVQQNAHQIEESGTALNDRTQQQAAAIEETAASMEEMTSSVQSIAEHAKAANDLAHKAQQNATLGRTVMQSAETSMKSIREQSHQIEDIVGLIDSIAFQTNLLALNAAVEAARAGEHGRGFAVVAAEVRNLAGKSSDASKDIRSLIADTVEQIEQGSAKFDESMHALEEIDASIGQLGSMVAEITTASNEQAGGILQVNQAIGAIDQTTQQNAAMVEETAAASESMSHVAQSQLTQLRKFKLSASGQPRLLTKK